MQQLIDQLTEQYNISEEEAKGIINAVVNYAEEKSPDLKNLLSKVFGDDTEEGEEQTSKADENEQDDTTVQPAAKQPATALAGEHEETMFDKAKGFVEEHIPGGMKEKTEEMMGEMGTKLKRLFS